MKTASPEKTGQYPGRGKLISFRWRVNDHIATQYHRVRRRAVGKGRSLGSPDLLSGGRAAWHVVTSAAEFEVRNNGYGGSAAEGGALRPRRSTGGLFRALGRLGRGCGGARPGSTASSWMPPRVRYAAHEGRYIRVHWPLSIPRSPQGRPVILQAGSSPRRREFAARRAAAPGRHGFGHSGASPTRQAAGIAGAPAAAARRIGTREVDSRDP
ncbi:LLM class flavin-dependent oxidoreductase [Roseomonas hellenica]|nr:LLM class flavin-dependent oxidoreductase [Plastoroseomonas hellenica]